MGIGQFSVGKEKFLDQYQKSLEAISAGVRNIYEALPVPRCAAAMGVAEKTAYSYKNDVMIPVERLLRLLEFARDSVNTVAVDQCHRISQVFAAAGGQKVIDPAVVEIFNRGVDALNNGGKLQDRKKEQCPHCRSDLFTERTARGLVVYVCKRCFGAGMNCQ